MRRSTGLRVGDAAARAMTADASPADTRPMNVIEVTDLVKRYGERTAVDGVSFTVEEGEIFAILGPNGAGKTTTVESIGGPADAGLGHDQRARARPAARPGRAPSRRRHPAPGERAPRPDPGRGRRSTCTPRSTRPRATASSCSIDLGLADKRKSMFGKLSGGQKQRLSIALALIGNPRIAILDELTTGLDPQARRDTWQLIEDVRAGGVTVILVTHFMEEAERLADRIALIDAGRAGRPRHACRDRVPRRRRAAAPVPAVRPDRRRAAHGPARGPHRDPHRARRSSSRAPATSCPPSRRSSRATRSWPTSCASSRPALDDAFVALTGRKLAS